jgi:tRNA pseudouridine38-40 synthase
MVRAIVGTLLEVGKGRLTVEDFRTIIKARDRRAAGVSAPANGLFLVDIEYKPEIESLLDKDYEIFWTQNI